MPGSRPLVALLAVFLLAAAPAAAPGEPVRITVVATADIHGALSRGVQPWSGGEDVAGMDTLSGYLRAVREENPGGVVAVDAGDLMQGTLVSGRFKGRPMTLALRRMGFDAVALGNHEFDWGLRALRRRGRDVRFLGANVAAAVGATARLRAAPFRVVGRKGVRVGIVGIAHPDTPELTSPKKVEDLVFGDPVEAVLDSLDALDAAGADLAIVVAHVGAKGDGYGRMGELARALDPARVHLIVGGHTHGRTTAVENGIPLLQPWPQGTGFGRVDLEIDPETGAVTSTFPEVKTAWITGIDGPAYYRGRLVEPERRLTRLVARWEKRVARVRARPVGAATGPFTRDRRRESPLGDLVSDVIRAGPPEADFGIVNSGGLRADLPEGEITFGDVYEVMPFDNTVVRVRLTGEEVRAVLELGVLGDHGVVQVSGLRFEFDYDLPPGERLLGPVLDARTGEPLEPGRTYLVAVPDFLADGGDGFTVLAAAPHERDDALVRDLLAAWIRRHRPLAPPDPETERRMVAHGTP